MPAEHAPNAFIGDEAIGHNRAPPFNGEAASGRRAVTPDRVIANGKIKHALGWQPEFPTFREGYAGSLETRGQP